jgi:hypothetical protein
MELAGRSVIDWKIATLNAEFNLSELKGAATGNLGEIEFGYGDTVILSSEGNYALGIQASLLGGEIGFDETK